jgi:NAD(P)-dependent dehydrogenase (short-subunit alcohol dehydrogenase family)
MTTILITSANRGIGLALAQHAAKRGYTVIGTARTPDSADALRATGARVEQLEMISDESCKALAIRLGDEAIDVVINNAGIFLHDCDDLEDFNAESFMRTLETNTLGPLLLTRALIPQLERSERKLLVQHSSDLGSIADASTGRQGALGYRISKAGLNMATATIAHELKPRGITCVAVHPGWVRTDLGGPHADLSSDESASSILDTIEGLTHADSGRYMDFAGNELPW